jgi:hypothetical protein
MCSAGLVREPVGGEELGLLQAMTATGASLSLALNIVATSTYPSLAVIFQPCVSFNSQRTLQWDFVVGENYSSKKKIFKAFFFFSRCNDRIVTTFSSPTRCLSVRSLSSSGVRGLGLKLSPKP